MPARKQTALELKLAHNAARRRQAALNAGYAGPGRGKKSTAEFIEKAKEKRGQDGFDYSLVKYESCTTEVTLICPKGHTTHQTPSDHLAGKKCRHCEGHNTEGFIALAIAKRGQDGFDYSLVDYRTRTTEVTLICPKGHTTHQTPSQHLSGRKCQVCRTGTLDEFLADAARIRGHEGFDYSGAVYVDRNTKLTITCKAGHTLQQTPNAHLVQGAGCNMCAGRVITAEMFLERAEGRFGFDYSGMDYVNYKTPITITCLKGHTFKQAPNEHLTERSRGGCQVCSGTAKGTTAGFIEKAIAQHGLGKYDYSKSVYVGKDKKLEIICPEHGIFWQSPANHTKGRGCYHCFIGRKLKTTAKFIEDAQLAHPGKYDYSRTDYKHGQKPVEIICPEHGSFWQRPAIHLGGSGCPECGVAASVAGAAARAIKTRDTGADFLAKAKDKRGHEGYGYHLVDYVDQATKVTFVCPDGHLIQQTPRAHLSGKGCWICSNRPPAGDTEKMAQLFLARSKERFGDAAFDYSLVQYETAEDPITLVCRAQGHQFQQKPDRHLHGAGCPVCNVSEAYTTEEFITIAKEKRGHEGYGYHLVDYVNGKTPITLVCPDGHTYQQIPGSHVKGAGCTVCSEGGGYKTHKEGLLYYLRVTCAGVIRYKIGITNRTVQDRFCPGDMKMIEVLGLYTNSDGWAALNKETFLLGHFKHAQYTGPDILASGGNTEIFNYDVLGLEDGGDLILAVNRLQRDVIRRQVA